MFTRVLCQNIPPLSFLSLSLSLQHLALSCFVVCSGVHVRSCLPGFCVKISPPPSFLSLSLISPAPYIVVFRSLFRRSCSFMFTRVLCQNIPPPFLSIAISISPAPYIVVFPSLLRRSCLPGFCVKISPPPFLPIAISISPAPYIVLRARVPIWTPGLRVEGWGLRYDVTCVYEIYTASATRFLVVVVVAWVGLC